MVLTACLSVPVNSGPSVADLVRISKTRGKYNPRRDAEAAVREVREVFRLAAEQGGESHRFSVAECMERKVPSVLIGIAVVQQVVRSLFHAGQERVKQQFDDSVRFRETRQAAQHVPDDDVRGLVSKVRQRRVEIHEVFGQGLFGKLFDNFDDRLVERTVEEIHHPGKLLLPHPEQIGGLGKA